MCPIGKRPRIENCLTIFSKTPLQDSKVSVNEKKTSIITTHTTAGGLFRHPESRKTNTIRERHIYQILNALGEERISIIAEDINAGPNVSQCNYNLFKQYGLKDSYFEHNPKLDYTWVPTN